MPVASGDDRQPFGEEQIDVAIDYRHHLVAIGYAERAAREEIILYIDDDQCVAILEFDCRCGCNIHFHAPDCTRRRSPYMVWRNSGRNLASGRVFKTSAASSQPRRAWPMAKRRLAKSSTLWASEAMLIKTPSLFAILQ